MATKLDTPRRRVVRSPERKADALNRLRSVRGHVDAVIRMIEEDAYCIDVIKQISAVRAALDRVGRLELRKHFETCFAQAVRAGNDRKVVDELLEALAFNKDLFGTRLRNRPNSRSPACPALRARHASRRRSKTCRAWRKRG